MKNCSRQHSLPFGPMFRSLVAFGRAKNMSRPETMAREIATRDVFVRKQLVHEIDKKLQMGGVRPSITFAGIAFGRRHYAKGYVPSLDHHFRTEDVGLGK